MERMLQANFLFDGRFGSKLDRGTVSQGIRKREAQFKDINARLFQHRQERFRHGKARKSERDVSAKKFFSVPVRRSNGLDQSIVHEEGAPGILTLNFRTTSKSLSPRPERQIAILEPRGKLRARRTR